MRASARLRRGVWAGCQFLDGFINQLQFFDGQRAVLGLLPLPAGDPDRYPQFQNSLAQFRDGFTGTEGVLIAAAAQPQVRRRGRNCETVRRFPWARCRSMRCST